MILWYRDDGTRSLLGIAKNPGFSKEPGYCPGTREQPVSFCASWTARHCDLSRISTRTNMQYPRANLNAFQHSDHVFPDPQRKFVVSVCIHPGSGTLNNKKLLAKLKLWLRKRH